MSAILRDTDRRRRRRSYAPTSNTTSHDNHEKINSWVFFSFLYGCGARLGGPSGGRRSAITLLTRARLLARARQIISNAYRTIDVKTYVTAFEIEQIHGKKRKTHTTPLPPFVNFESTHIADFFSPSTL